METSQNIENVQKTNLKNLHVEFDHLSVVPEENSGENSDKNSTHEQWNGNVEKDVLKADQSYPAYDNLNKSSTLPVTNRIQPKHFFSPIKRDNVDEENQTLYPHQHYSDIYNPCKFTTFKPFNQIPDYANLPLPTPQPPPPPPPQTDKIINNAPSVYFPHPDNLQEVQSLRKSNTDLIVKMDNYNFNNTHNSQSTTFSNGGNLEELLNDIECISQDILKISNSQLAPIKDEKQETIQNDKPYKSELNVVLMPTPMPLIGFDKYRDISNENLATKSMESLSISNQNLRVIPDNVEHNFPLYQPYPPPPQGIPSKSDQTPLPPPTINITTPIPTPEMNPFFFGNFPAPQTDYFHARYNPDTFFERKNLQKSEKEICNSKCNLLDLTSSEHVSSENEENLKLKTTQPPQPSAQQEETIKNNETNKKAENKTPKLSIRRKVSIHFKGKKEKKLKDKKEEKDEKKKISHQKTPSMDSKKSITDLTEVKTQPDKKSSSNTEQRSSISDKNTSDKEKGNTSGSSKDKKQRKSSSVSPDRKHVHVKEDGKKCHKKHKRLDRQRSRRSVNSRERSYSICTDRSNILDHRLGLTGFSMYDDYSDRDRSNSLSSCDTVHRRKMSSISQFPVNGKIPWCGCWGNGCL